jgi:hypothetical protein
MPCPICYHEPGSGTDHRYCLVQLFREKKISSIADWEKLSKKPKTIIKGKVTIKVKNEEE